jgi:hypothetical protein
MSPALWGRSMGFFVTSGNDIRHFRQAGIAAYDGIQGMPNPGAVTRSTVVAGTPGPAGIHIKIRGDCMNATTSTSNPTAFGSLVNIFLEPKKALNDIQSHTGWVWLPFLLLFVLLIGFQLWYLSVVDLSWFADQILAPKAANMTADQLRDAHARMTPNGMRIFTVIVGTVFFVLWYMIQTLYFFFVSKIGGYKEQRFGAWFSFVMWTALPALIGLLASAVFLLTSSSKQISPVDIDVTSLNTLVFHIPFGTTWQNLVSNFRLTALWSIVLMVIGFGMWTGKNLRQSITVVASLYAGVTVLWIIWDIVFP